MEQHWHAASPKIAVDRQRTQQLHCSLHLVQQRQGYIAAVGQAVMKMGRKM